MLLRAPHPLLPLAAVLIAFVLTTTGCGYRLQTEHGDRFASPDLRVDLESFDNLSFEADAGVFIASRLREELRRTGFRGTFGRLNPDYLVAGKVRELREDVTTHDASGYGLERRLTLIVDIRVMDASKGRVLWKEEGLNEAAAFYAGPDFQYTESNRRVAFEELARRIAVRLSQTIRMML